MMRILSAAGAALVCSVLLCGCGGPGFQGTLNENGNGSPQPAAGQPAVTGVSPASAVAGGPGFTLTVTGRNFAQGDSVQWSNIPLASTFVSSTEMTAIVPSSMLAVNGTPTTVSVIVQTPVPYSLNFGSNISITAPPPPGNAGFTLSTLSVQANDMAWDPASQRIYLSIAGGAPDHPNTITALDPTTLQSGTAVSAGSGANRMAISSDGSWLYAGIDKNGTVQRFSLPGLQPDIAIPLGTGSGSAPNRAFDIEPDPVAANTIAVSQDSSLTEAGNVVIYDGATPRPATAAGVGGYPEPVTSLCWNGSGTSLYSSFGLSATLPIGVFAVSSTGVQLVSSTKAVNMGTIRCSALTGNVYGNYGQIFDPSTNDLSNRLPLLVVNGGIPADQDTPLAVDDSLGLAWIVAQTVNSPAGQMTLAAFDLRTNALLGSIAIPNVTGKPVKLIRWGSNGLAFLTQEGTGPQQGDGVYIVSGAFVTTPSTQVERAPGARK